jgi:hypothetical protein
MSLKFLSGLQDFLGLYDGSAAAATSSTSSHGHVVSSLFGASSSSSSAVDSAAKRLLKSEGRESNFILLDCMYILIQRSRTVRSPDVPTREMFIFPERNI